VDKQEALDVLKQGMATEIWGYRFYEQAVARTVDETGKRVFGSLATEEKKHLAILLGEYASISGGKNWLSIKEATAMADAAKATDIFPEASEAENLVPPEATDEEALQMALDSERRGYDLYVSEAEKTESAEAKAMWEFLAKAEDLHYAFLDKTLEFLKTNGTWYFDERELPFFEG